MNDIFDINYDKNHPLKKNRPIASGIISKKKAILLGLFSFLLGVLILFFLSKESLFLSCFYFVLNFFYSLKLKHIPIVDFMIISVGFVIRILIGGVVADIEISQWLIVLVFLLSIFIAVSKRRDDVYQYEILNKINRKVVFKYNLEFIDKIITITSSVLIVSYLLFITSDEISNRYNSYSLMISFFLVLIGIFRYNQLTYVYNKSGDPLKLLFKDYSLQLIVILWFLCFYYSLYI